MDGLTATVPLDDLDDLFEDSEDGEDLQEPPVCMYVRVSGERLSNLFMYADIHTKFVVLE